MNGTVGYELLFHSRFNYPSTMFSRPIFIGLLCCLISLRSVQAQESSPAPATSTKMEAAKSFDPVEATKAWLNTVPADKRAKSDAYFEGGYWLILWNSLVGAAIAIFLLASKWSARLRGFAERTTNSKSIHVAVYAVPFVLIVAALSFPLAFYQLFLREYQFVFASQTFRSLFLEQLVCLGVLLFA